MTTRRSATRVAVPSYLTRFVGREPELTQLRQFLQSSSSRGEPERRRPTPRPRLLTLCGPGGSGKTRLASEFSHAVGRAATVGRARVDAVYWVALGSVHEASQLARAVAAACGSPVVGAARVLDNLALLLGDRRVLVVLDNCEHLLDACAALLPPLLAACPGLLVVTTSRVPIGLPGELVLPVPPLRSVSSDGTRSESAGLSEAGLLFLDRAALGFVDGRRSQEAG